MLFKQLGWFGRTFQINRFQPLLAAAPQPTIQNPVGHALGHVLATAPQPTTQDPVGHAVGHTLGTIARPAAAALISGAMLPSKR